MVVVKYLPLGENSNSKFKGSVALIILYLKDYYFWI